MEIPRTIAGCRGHMVMGDERSSQRANSLLHLGGGCRICQDCDVGAWSTLSLELCRGLCHGHGGLFRQPAGGLDCFQYAGGVVFTFLDVRLIERVNLQEVACQGCGDFPPEKFCREILTVLEREHQERVALWREPGDLSVGLSILISLQPQIDKELVGAVGGPSWDSTIGSEDE